MTFNTSSAQEFSAIRTVKADYSGATPEPAEYLRYFNFDRAHTGRLTKGRVPGDIVFGARKTRTVQMSTMCRYVLGLGRSRGT